MTNAAPMTAAQAAMALQASRRGDESDQEPEPQASSSGTNTNAPAEAENIQGRQITDEDYDSETSDFYSVEEIRAKRTNPRTGALEYFIKWEGYPESQNSWEPSENLNCPDVVLRFNEREKAKRKRLRNISTDSARSTGSAQKRPRRSEVGKQDPVAPEEPLLLEENSNHGSLTETLSSSDGQTETERPKQTETRVQESGFARGLSLERIVNSITDEDVNKIWFMVKWKGMDDIEMVEANELETNTPRELCLWYKERLYHTLDKPNSDNTSDMLKSR